VREEQLVVPVAQDEEEQLDPKQEALLRLAVERSWLSAPGDGEDADETDPPEDEFDPEFAESGTPLVLLAAQPGVSLAVAEAARDWHDTCAYGLWLVEDPEPRPGVWLTDIVSGIRRYTAIAPEQLEGLHRWSVILGPVVAIEGVKRTGGTFIALRPDEGDAAAAVVKEAAGDIIRVLDGSAPAAAPSRAPRMPPRAVRSASPSGPVEMIVGAMLSESARKFAPPTHAAGWTAPDLAPAPIDASVLEPYQHLLHGLTSGSPTIEEHSELVDCALDVWARPGFETFVCEPRLRFEPFPHQLEAAARVLRHMQGRAILADEVGLGKTIEAGIVLSELRLRGLAHRTLVLAPAGLVEQWQEELERKFALPCAVADARSLARIRGGPTRTDGGEPVVIASLAAARRERLQAMLAADGWDLVIADEAHRLKNARSASARLARSLRTRYLLLLTATPIENRLADLFQLVNLVRPGLLGDAAALRSRHGGGDGSAVRNVASLQLALRELMVRHRRSEISLMLPRRLAETFRVVPSDAEAELYHGISARVRAEARGATSARLLVLRSAQQLAGSSPWACSGILSKLGWSDLAGDAASIPSTGKATALLELLARHLARDEKVIVFTAYRRTLEALVALLAGEGIEAAVYHGSLPRAHKDAAVARFAETTPVLLTTEAAGEGRNLQFCHVMVNFDLPWNPMQIEQRLGRIHRIGQRHDVQLANLVAQGTIEERLLGVLQSKINLFELVVGELDMILGRVSEDLDFESLVFREHVASRDDAEFDGRLQRVGDELAQARTGYLATRERVDVLVGDA
jgi:SNF2 family DNA or RNA helicase